jgi:histidine triad (HIT) family protein
MSDCVFCKIVIGEFESSKVYEDEKILAFMDINPVNTGHILIIPKKHVELIAELDDGTSGKMFVLANKINRALRVSDIRLEGINYFLADGKAAGQEVFHAHLHVFPRFKNDGFGLKFNENYRKNRPAKSVFDSIAEQVKSNLQLN